jgi:hypothetical protein
LVFLQQKAKNSLEAPDFNSVPPQDVKLRRQPSDILRSLPYTANCDYRASLSAQSSIHC